MKKVKSALLAALAFLVAPFVDPTEDRVAPYPLGIIAAVLVGLLVAGRPYPGLLGVVLALMLADKALAAWIALRGREDPAPRPGRKAG